MGFKRKAYKPRKKANWEEYTSQDFSQIVKINEELKKVFNVTSLTTSTNVLTSGFLTSLFDKDQTTSFLIQNDGTSPATNTASIVLSLKRRIFIQGGLFSFNLTGLAGSGSGTVILYGSDDGVNFFEIGRGTKTAGVFNTDFNIIVPEMNAYSFKIDLSISNTGWQAYLYGLDINV